MGSLRTKTFWGDALERALSTAAQVVLTVLGADAVNIVQTSYSPAQLISVAAIGFGLSLLKAIAAGSVGNKESASLIE